MADSLFSRALIQARSELGAQHHDYFLVLISRGAFFAEERQYAGAESCYVEVIRALESQPGKDPLTLWISMGLLGLLYENTDRSDEASVLYAKEIDLRDQLGQDVDEGYAENLGDLARVYTRGQHFERATKVLLRALKAWQSLRRAEDPRALECKMSLGRSYLMMDSLNLAETIFKELSMQGQTSPDRNDTLTIDALGNLALTYSKLDRFQEAEICLRNAYKLCKLSKIMKGAREARILGGLGSLEYEMGNYSEAESLMIRSNTIWRSQIKNDSLEYARSLNDLAVLYLAQGRSAFAEETFSTAREFLSRTTGKATPEYLTVLNNLGVASVGLGRYRDARDILTRVITLQQSNVKSSSLEYARSLNNLGLAYLNLRQYPIAESLFTQARACLKDSLGLTSTIGFQIGLNLVRVWKERGDLSRSMNLANSLVYQGRTRLGQNRVLYPEALYLLAMVYYATRDYTKADSILTESNRIFKSMLGPDHPILASELFFRAWILKKVGQITDAANAYQSSLLSFQHLQNTSLPLLSENAQLGFVEMISQVYEAYNSFAMGPLWDLPSTRGDLYSHQLQTKGQLAGFAKRIRLAIVKGGDEHVIGQYRELVKRREAISKFYSISQLRMLGDQREIDSLQSEAVKIEKDLLKFMGVNQLVESEREISWEDVRRALRPGEAAVELVRFRSFTDHLTDTVHYGAFVVTPESEYPAAVVLDNGNELETLCLREYGDVMVDQRHKLIDEHHVEEVLGNLYLQFWKRIQDSLTDVKHVYISLDGVYNKINLQTLFDPNTRRYLIDELDLQVVTSTRDIPTLHRNVEPELQKTAELFGYPNYSLPAERQGLLGANYERGDDAFIPGPTSDSLSRYQLSDLPGTKKEIETIQKLLLNKNWLVSTHLGDDALKGAVKAVRSPRVIVLATHGYFIPDYDHNRQSGIELGSLTWRVVDDPLLRSGLLFAGAGRTLRKSNASLAGETDNGILTAYEAMNLDLENTDLAVLSACETGLGEIRNGEGVYGLQRAFKIAGANTIIMSLWRVDDEATEELTTGFFQYWLSGMDKEHAFTRSILEVKKRHPSPYYWGAFVLVN
jgi:CHAT domain-containing protein/tetratricopeptide (TPR) repeat protein